MIKKIKENYFHIIDEKNKRFVFGRYEKPNIIITLIGGSRSLKTLIPKLVKHYKTNKIIFYNIKNEALMYKIRGTIYIKKEGDHNVVSIKTKWQESKTIKTKRKRKSHYRRLKDMSIGRSQRSST